MRFKIAVAISLSLSAMAVAQIIPFAFWKKITAAFPSDQIDDDNSSTGFDGGSHLGTVWDTSYIKLATTGTPTNNSALDSSWTPQYSSLVGYYQFTGSGAMVNGDTVTATVGTNGTVVDPATTGTMSYTASGRLGSGLRVGAAGDAVRVVSTFGSPANITAMAWVNLTTKGTSGSDVVWMSDRVVIRLDSSAGGTGITAFYYDGTSYNQTSASPTLTALNKGWNHIVYTYNDSADSQRIYVNGVLSGSTTYTGSINWSSATDTYIGKHNTNSNYQFVGDIDEVAVFNTVLTAAEIQHIYSRQSSPYSGVFTSRIMNAGSALPWSSISWATSIPNLKELPDAADSENANSYSGLPSYFPSSGLKGLWRLDELTTGTVPSSKDFSDSSGNVNSGTAVGGLTLGSTGLAIAAPTFDGTNDAINLGSGPQLGAMTVSAWIKLGATLSGTRMIVMRSGNSSNHNFWFQLDSSRLSFGFKSASGSPTIAGTNTTWTVGQWYHVTGTYDGSGTGAVYLNGVAESISSGSLTGTPVTPVSPILSIGGNLTDSAAFFNGQIDEVGLWDRALTSTEVAALAARPLMSGIQALWHLNETTTGTAPSSTDFKDDSGNSHHGTKNSGVAMGDYSILDVAPTFNGSTGRITTANNITVTSNSFSAQAWVRTSATSGFILYMLSGSDTWSVLEMLSGQARFCVPTIGCGQGTTINDMKWHHLVITGSTTGTNTDIKLYVDGNSTPVATGFNSSSFSGTGTFSIGSSTAGGSYFTGQIDEVAIWNRALSASEILTLYRRGANRVKFQVRSCISSTCVNAADTWKGPGGSDQTYFSELNNNTIPFARTGDVKIALPNMSFSDFSSLTITNRQYFQYRAVLENESTTTSQSPFLKSVTVGPAR